MTQPRSNLISLQDTPYYHCISRCVRRAYLCGQDFYSGQSYEHRREWITDRLSVLANMFCIEICAYAVMSNHYHLVLRVDRDAVIQLTDDEVIERWQMLFKGPVLVQRYQQGQLGTKAEYDTVADIIAVWRERLTDISWFMRCLNEHIARLANAEDGCTGRFWEGRFKSQALLDEAAVLACMAYVDLNPVRAGIADTPENSEFTSIRERTIKNNQHSVGKLGTFRGDDHKDKRDGIPFTFRDYLLLVDSTGRFSRPDKRGAIPLTQMPILERLGLDVDSWLDMVAGIENNFGLRVYAGGNTRSKVA
ncbi:MAG: transposase [Pseudomonadales bacterium]|nr:transposase [Pseudomonadales bacterium]